VIQAAILVLLGTLRQGGPTTGTLFASGKFELILVAAATGLAAMAIGLMISALVSNPDKALTILPVVLLAQFLLSGAFFDVTSSVVLGPLSYLNSARWGFAAAASTADLQSLTGRKCTTAVANDPSCDPFRAHTTGRWLFDMLMVLVLTLVPLLIASTLVRRVGRPRR
jgi:hypothetical protein